MNQYIGKAGDVLELEVHIWATIRDDGTVHFQASDAVGPVTHGSMQKLLLEKQNITFTLTDNYDVRGTAIAATEKEIENVRVQLTMLEARLRTLQTIDLVPTVLADAPSDDDIPF